MPAPGPSRPANIRGPVGVGAPDEGAQPQTAQFGTPFGTGLGGAGTPLNTGWALPDSDSTVARGQQDASMPGAGLPRSSSIRSAGAGSNLGWRAVSFPEQMHGGFPEQMHAVSFPPQGEDARFGPPSMLPPPASHLEWSPSPRGSRPPSPPPGPQVQGWAGIAAPAGLVSVQNVRAHTAAHHSSWQGAQHDSRHPSGESDGRPPMYSQRGDQWTPLPHPPTMHQAEHAAWSADAGGYRADHGRRVVPFSEIVASPNGRTIVHPLYHQGHARSPVTSGAGSFEYGPIQPYQHQPVISVHPSQAFGGRPVHGSGVDAVLGVSPSWAGVGPPRVQSNGPYIPVAELVEHPGFQVASPPQLDPVPGMRKPLPPAPLPPPSKDMFEKRDHQLTIDLEEVELHPTSAPTLEPRWYESLSYFVSFHPCSLDPGARPMPRESPTATQDGMQIVSQVQPGMMPQVRVGHLGQPFQDQDASEKPFKFVLKSPLHEKHCAGTYIRDPDMEANGEPVYTKDHQSGDRYMYMSPDGVWCVWDKQARDQNFQCAHGWLHYPAAQGTRLLPHQLPFGGWRYFDGQTWHEDPAIRVTDISKPCPVVLFREKHLSMKVEYLDMSLVVYLWGRKSAGGFTSETVLIGHFQVPLRDFEKQRVPQKWGFFDLQTNDQVADVRFTYSVCSTPGKIAKPRVTDVRRTEVTLQWDKPENDHGSPVVAYHLGILMPSSGGPQRHILCERTKTDSPVFVVTNLEGNKSYLVDVRAINDVGVGDALEFEITTAPIQPDSPDKPWIEEIRDGCLCVAWQSGQSDGGSELTCFKVRMRKTLGAHKMNTHVVARTVGLGPKEQEAWIDMGTVAAAQEDANEPSMYTAWVGPLENSTCEYCFQVMAASAAGISQPSELSEPYYVE